jgi:hypothetical protein
LIRKIEIVDIRLDGLAEAENNAAIDPRTQAMRIYGAVLDQAVAAGWWR